MFKIPAPAKYFIKNMFICTIFRVNVQNGETLDFRSIELFFCSFALTCSFVLIRVNVQKGEIFYFSSIEYLFVYVCSKISSMAIIIIYGQKGEILNFSSIEHFFDHLH